MLYRKRVTIRAQSRVTTARQLSKTCRRSIRSAFDRLIGVYRV
jgi:hypothetical protein